MCSPNDAKEGNMQSTTYKNREQKRASPSGRVRAGRWSHLQEHVGTSTTGAGQRAGTVQGNEPGRCRATSREEQGRHEHGWGGGEERREEESEAQEGAAGAGKAA